MLKYVLLTVLVVHGAMSDGYLDFTVQNLTCTDDLCMGCFTGRHFFQSLSLYTFEIATYPSYRIEYTSLTGDSDRRMHFIDEEKSQPFRWCSELFSRADSIFGFDWRTTVCFQDDMSGITVPPECPKPVMLVTLEGKMGDQGIHVVQTLHCRT